VIVCHCNVILKREIEDAVRSILGRDPGASLEPQLVYFELQKRGRCCSCFPTVAAIVEDLLADAMNDVQGVDLASASPLRQLMSKDA